MHPITMPVSTGDIGYLYFNLRAIKKPTARQKEMLARIEDVFYITVMGLRRGVLEPIENSK